MKRTITCIAIALATLIAAPDRQAWADEPPPTKEQLDAAKKAFTEGNALYQAGKFLEAVEKLKESYALSKSPFLLYNIGHTYDQAGQADQALDYYNKFLAMAPQSAPMRPDVQKRVEALSKKEEVTPPTTPDKPSPYAETDFKHEIVFSAPKGKPLDIVASVPVDKGLVVSLFYRGSGTATFETSPMTKRDKEMVGQIPGDKIAGGWVQYYVEVRDSENTLVRRWGKSTSPNLVNIEGGTSSLSSGPVDPFAHQRRPDGTVEIKQDIPPAKYGVVKWVSTGVAVALIGGTVVAFTSAKAQHDKLVADSVSCGPPPCRPFDAEFGQKVEDLGVSYNRIYQVTLGVSIAAIAVTGYFWYANLTDKPKPREVNAKRKTSSPTWAVSPTIGDGFAGASALGRF